MIRRPPRSTLSSSSAASDVYKRQGGRLHDDEIVIGMELARRCQAEQQGCKGNAEQGPSVGYRGHWSPPLKHQAPGNEGAGRFALRMIEKALCRLMLDDTAVMQED